MTILILSDMTDITKKYKIGRSQKSRKKKEFRGVLLRHKPNDVKKNLFFFPSHQIVKPLPKGEA